MREEGGCMREEGVVGQQCFTYEANKTFHSDNRQTDRQTDRGLKINLRIMVNIFLKNAISEFLTLILMLIVQHRLPLRITCVRTSFGAT